MAFSHGVQSVEATVPENVLIRDSINSTVHFVSAHNYDNIVTAFYYDSEYSQKSDPKNGLENKIYMNGSEVDNVYAAYTTSGSTSDNSADIDGGNVNQFAAAAYSATGLQQGNYMLANSTKVGDILAGAIGGGKLINNTVEATNVTVLGSVAGAYATGSGASNDNIAIFKSGTTTFLGGAISDNSAVINNNATIKGGRASYAYGGISYGKANVSKNILQVQGGEGYSACGGESNGGSVNDNMVIVTGGKFDMLYGSNTNEKSSATRNAVVINNDIKPITITRDIYGASVELDTAKNNFVKVEVNCSFIENVYGADSWGGSVIGNNVRIVNNAINNVYGGNTMDNGVATGNSVFVKNGSVKNNVVGACTEKGAAKNNSVEYLFCSGSTANLIGAKSAEGGIVSGNYVSSYGSNCNSAIGAMTVDSGKASNNKVVINSTTATDVTGAVTENGAVSKNSVELTNKSIISGYVYGAFSNSVGAVSNNSVKITDRSYVEKEAAGGISSYGAVSKNVIDVQTSNDNSGQYFGGKSNTSKVISNKANYYGKQALAVMGGNSVAGLVSSNQATILGGQVAHVVGGASMLGQATKNKVIIEDGTSKFVVGGYSGDFEGGAVASSNTVTINGGTFKNFEATNCLERLKGY